MAKTLLGSSTTGKDMGFSKFEHFGWGVLRSAMWPVESWLTLTRDERRQQLATATCDEHYREALALASPSLLAFCDRSEGATEGDRGLSKYLSRAACRSTPFGMFASVSPCRIDGHEAPRLLLSPRHTCVRHARLDGGAAQRLCEWINKQDQSRQRLSFAPNSSLVALGDKFHYVEERTAAGRREHHLVSVDATDEVRAVLQWARSGATAAELAARVREADSEVEMEDALEFVMDLVDAQVLVSRVWPRQTGATPLSGIAEVCEQAGLSQQASRVRDIEDIVERLSGTRVKSPEDYAGVASSLPFDDAPDNLVQVDLSRPVDGVLSESDISVIAEAVQIAGWLRPLSEPMGALDRFRERFEERYDGAVVPLLLALDDDAGIGFDEGPQDQSKSEKPGARERRAWAAKLRLKWLLAGLRGQSAVQIDAADLAGAPDRPHEWTPTLSALVAFGHNEDGSGVYVLKGVVDGSGTKLLGRFAHCDHQIAALTQKVADADREAAPQGLTVEVVHLPAGRVGNVLFRGLERDADLEYLGTSGRSKAIPASELAVSVRGGTIVLTHEPSGTPVSPYLGNAHNVASGLPVYRFLAALQFQQSFRPGSWSWGDLETAEWLPRVLWKNVVVARAQWRLEGDVVSAITRARGRGLPRWVVVADGDNELALDLDNADDVEVVRKRAGKAGRATLIELWPTPSMMAAYSDEGGHVSELVVPFLTRRGRPASRVERSVIRLRDVRKGPASEWKYGAIYCGRAAAERIIRQEVGTLLAALEPVGPVEWFFVRYADPDPHVRIRVRCPESTARFAATEVLVEWLESLLNRELAWKVRLETYSREVARYGGVEGVNAAERLFCVDSEWVRRLLLSGTIDSDADRRRAAVGTANAHLTGLGLSISERSAVAESLRGQLEKEFRIGRVHRIGVGKAFRLERAMHERFVDCRDPGDERESKLFELVDAGKAPSIMVPDSVDRQAFARSSVHMHLNRLFRSEARMQELFVYDALSRVYKSLLNRDGGVLAERVVKER